ncbi:MAG: alpha/beta hydrolase [Hyphomonadaceae bacterium]
MSRTVIAAGVTAALLAACGNPTPPATPVAVPVADVPAPEMAPAPAQLDADMQEVLTKLASLGGKPIESLEPAEARKQPTPADAVMALIAEKGIVKAQPITVTTKDVTYPAGKGTQKARIYTPADAKGPLPVVLYIHGGGWVIADIDVYDSSPRALAEAAQAIVVSVAYRHAPENKFPAAHDDANAAYKWVLANAAKWNGDPKRVAIVGESAGGNMAVDVAIFARDNKLEAPKHVVAVYPVANTSPDLAAKKTYADAKPLNGPMLDWFFKHTLASPDQASDPRLNLVSANLAGLPATTIILAEIDPLHDDGVTLADALKAAGVQTELKEYKGVTHEFFGMGAVVADAKDAVSFAGGKLKSALAQ